MCFFLQVNSFFFYVKVINPEIKTKEASALLTKAACFVLNKPVSKNDIENMWQHVLPKKSPELNKINIAETHEKQIEAFRENLKRQTVGQASLLGRRSFNETFKISETSQKRRSKANAEWKTKPTCPIEIENKRKKKTNVKNNVPKDNKVWTYERHTKFLDAITILGEESKFYLFHFLPILLCLHHFLIFIYPADSRPKAILKSINDPNLNLREVASHLQVIYISSTYNIVSGSTLIIITFFI